MIRRALFTLLAISSLGCPGPNPPAQQEVVSGIYSLSESSELDTCDPPRWTGEQGRVAVVVQGSQVNVPIYLDRPLGSITRQILQLGVPTRAGASEVSTVRREAEVELVGLEPLQVKAHQTFTVAGPPDESIASWGLPKASCENRRLLEYTLVEPCESPCEMRTIYRLADGGQSSDITFAFDKSATADIVCECP